jgi:uncharacterized membrane protein
MEKKPRIEEVEEATRQRIVHHWPAVVALLAIVAAFSVLSRTLAPYPIVLAGMVVLGLLLIILERLLERYIVVRTIAFVLIAVVTLAEAISVLRLVYLLPRQGMSASALLRDAAIIWGINIVTFALWYWLIDGDGPRMRYERPHEAKDFLFPQQANKEDKNSWIPRFLDYLFLAFNHSTAFSPTDTAILSRRAKVLVMIQATLSLMAIAVLAARALNSL